MMPNKLRPPRNTETAVTTTQNTLVCLPAATYAGAGRIAASTSAHILTANMASATSANTPRMGPRTSVSTTPALIMSASRSRAPGSAARYSEPDAVAAPPLSAGPALPGVVDRTLARVRVVRRGFGAVPAPADRLPRAVVTVVAASDFSVTSAASSAAASSAGDALGSSADEPNASPADEAAALLAAEVTEKSEAATTVTTARGKRSAGAGTAPKPRRTTRTRAKVRSTTPGSAGPADSGGAATASGSE